MHENAGINRDNGRNRMRIAGKHGTFWYEAVVERRELTAPTLDASINRSRFYRLARKIWRRMPYFMQRRLFWLRDRML
ncbi:hypothetical protein [Burkholderia glumae]|uniref:hypothetical protein n=1 Tax=Burkholderia glumae TaxID=337 RepID=UPI00265F7B0A|nr:hypothetical protein [Burkholderia glumae]